MTSTQLPTRRLLVTLLAYALAWLGTTLSVSPDGRPTIWLPTAVLFVALTWFRGRQLASFLAVTFVTDLTWRGAGQLMPGVAFWTVSLFEAWIATRLLRAQRFDRHFADLRDSVRFLLAGPIAAAGASAAVATAVGAIGVVGDGPVLEFFRTWWFAHALGLATLTPLLLSLAGARTRRVADWLRPSWPDAGAAALLVIMALIVMLSPTNAVFGMPVGPILLVPFVLYCAARGEVLAASAAGALFTAVVLFVAITGRGLFAQTDSRTAVIVAQEFILIVSQMTLGMAALLSQIRRRQADLEARNDALVAAEAAILALNNDLERRVAARTSDLEQALSQVRQLQGLLPICCYCKRVRGDEGYWHSVEQYIGDRTNAEFTHSICPHCLPAALDEVAKGL